MGGSAVFAGAPPSDADSLALPDDGGASSDAGPYAVTGAAAASGADADAGSAACRSASFPGSGPADADARTLIS